VNPPPAAPPTTAARPERLPSRLRAIFAEPPRLAQKTAPAAKSPKRRRKILMLVTLVLGAFVVLRPGGSGASEPVSELLEVETTEARLPVQPTIYVPVATAPIDREAAAAHLAAGRYEQALPPYRALAASEPTNAAYAAIVTVLTREVVDRCRARTSSACTPR
jgi:hypothetical protein